MTHYTYPMIDLSLASADMIPILKKVLDYHLASSSKDERENWQDKDIYICLAARIAESGNKAAISPSHVSYRICALIEDAMQTHNTKVFNHWFFAENGIYIPDGSYEMQQRRKTWVRLIIKQLEKHFK